MTNILLLFFVFFLAASFGSFFKLVVDRYNKNESFVTKPSYCELTHKPLLWWHNIPIFSYLLLAGRSYFNKKKYGIEYLIAEVITAFLAVGVFLKFGFENYSEAILTVLFFLILILLAFFDYKHGIVPHEITYTGILFALFASFYLSHDLSKPIFNLGIAFLLLDLLQSYGAAFKGFHVEASLMPILLIIWTGLYFYFPILYLIAIPVLLFIFLVYKNILSSKHTITFWTIFLIAFSFFIYKAQIIDLNLLKVKNYFVGIGILYLFCEILAYYVFFFLPDQADSSEDSEEKVVIGGGDVTVFALISTFLGIKSGFLVLFFASLLGLLSHLICKGIKANKNSEGELQYLPFVPFLMLATFIIILVYG